MSIAGRLFLVLFAVGAVVLAAGPYRQHTRPRVRCALPDRDYQFRKYSQPVRSLSSPAITLSAETIASGDTASASVNTLPNTLADSSQRRIKVFQFVENATLQIDHCWLSQISILLHESGHWTASMRANQNPLSFDTLTAPTDVTSAEPEQPVAGDLSRTLPNEIPSPPRDVVTAKPVRPFTEHLLRNKFIVDIRCFIGPVVGGVGALVGRPVVIPLQVKPFWVQSAKPEQVFATGYSQRVKDYFELIERVEIEFAYEHESTSFAK